MRIDFPCANDSRPMTIRNSPAQAVRLASFSLLLRASFCMTSPTKLPTPPSPATSSSAGPRTAQTRSGKSCWIGESAARKGCGCKEQRRD